MSLGMKLENLEMWRGVLVRGPINDGSGQHADKIRRTKRTCCSILGSNRVQGDFRTTAYRTQYNTCSLAESNDRPSSPFELLDLAAVTPKLKHTARAADSSQSRARRDEMRAGQGRGGDKRLRTELGETWKHDNTPYSDRLRRDTQTKPYASS